MDFWHWLAGLWNFVQEPLVWWASSGLVGTGVIVFLLRPRLAIEVEAQQEKTPDSESRMHDVSAVFSLKKTRRWRGSNSFWIEGDFWAEGTTKASVERLVVGLAKDETVLVVRASRPHGLAAPKSIQVLRRPKKMRLYIPYRFFFEWIDEGPTDIVDEEGEPLHNYQAYGRPGFLRLRYEVNGREKSLLLKFYADPAKEFHATSYGPDGEPTDFEWDGDASSIHEVHRWQILDRCNFWLIRHDQPMKTQWKDWMTFKRMSRQGRW